MVTSPRFDSPLHVVMNIVTIAIFVGVVTVGWTRRRRSEGPTAWGWIAILVNASVNGIYLPIGPVAWLLTHWSTPRNDADAVAETA